MSGHPTECNLCGAASADLLITKDGFHVVRCKGCQLVFVSNPPDDAALSEQYSFETGYHSELAHNPQSVAQHQKEALDNLRRLHEHRRGGTLLDVGCSTGLFLHAAHQAGWAVKGVEYSADTAQMARKTYGFDVRTGALGDADFQGEKFDVITLWDVLEHVPDPKQTLRHVLARLADDGLLLIKTPNVSGWFPQLSLRLAPRLGYWRHPEPPGHLFQFSPQTLGRMLGETGFESVAVRHGRIPLTYSFGRVGSWFRSLKWALYCALFVPLALLGPYFGAGDDFVVAARKAPRSRR